MEKDKNRNKCFPVRNYLIKIMKTNHEHENKSSEDGKNRSDLGLDNIMTLTMTSRGGHRNEKDLRTYETNM